MMPPTDFLRLTLLLVSALACATATFEPPVEVPERFSDSGALERAARWWEDLQDPELNPLIQEALASNLDLRSVWDRLEQARAIVRRETAALFPAIDGIGAAEKTRFDRPDFGLGKDTGESFELGAVLSYELDLWGRNRSGRDAARFDLAATEAELHAAAVSLSAFVATTWYTLVEQQGQLALLNEQIETNDQVARLLTLRFRMGQSGAADVLRQRQLVERTRGERVLVERDAELLVHALAVALGRAPIGARFDAPDELLAELPPLPSTGLPAELVAQRPDVQEAYFDVLAADRRLEVARADRYPRITLDGSTAYGAEHLRDLVDNWLATIAVGFVAPLIDGGERSAEVDRTRAVFSERLHRYGDVVLTSLQEVEDALVQERQQHEFITSLDKQLTLAQRTLERIGDRYRKGAVAYLDVLDALLSQQTLARSRLTAARDLITARIELHRALAGRFELEPPQLASNPTGATQ